MNNNSAAKKYIVACSSCQTKFAIPAQAIEGLAAPSFHCSRCDNVFSVNVGELKELASKETHDHARDSLTDSGYQEDSSDEGNESNNYQINAEMHSANNENRVSNTVIDTQIPDTQKEQAGYPFNLPDDSRTSSDSFSTEQNLNYKKESSEVRVPRFIEEAEEEPVHIEEPARSFTEQLEQDLKNIPQFDLDDEPSGYRGVETSPKPDKKAKKTKKPKNKLRDTNKEPNYWVDCALLSSPFLLALIFLSLTGFAFSQFPELGRNYLPTMIASLPESAPENLYISDLRYKEIDLESGEHVAIIAGTLNNDGREEYKTVEIEGLGFDEKGNVLQSARIYAGAGIGNTKLKSLSITMMNDLQSRPPLKKFKLEPESTYDFTIALTDGDSEKSPKHFSARVYSVIK